MIKIADEKPCFYAIIPANIRYDNKLTPNSKLLYGEITALTNEKGYCWASNNYFAELYGVSKTSISKWIASLEKQGYISNKLIYKEGSKEILHRYISLVTYPIEEKLHTPIEEKLKDNTTVINTTFNITFNIQEMFSVFWEKYPKKSAKKDAVKAWKKLKNNEDLFNEIIEGLDKAIKSVEWVKDGGKFIPHPATWLNGERWTDEVQEAQVGLFADKPKLNKREQQLEDLGRIMDDYDRCNGKKTNNDVFGELPQSW